MEAARGDYHLLFGDEAWWSLSTEIGRVWAKVPTRPVIPVCRKRAYVYVVGFVEPQTGKWMSYLVPGLNSDWYSEVLELLAREFLGQPIKLIVDRAGWHIGKDVSVPDSISMEFLPPHSPELNPTEQVWQDVRYNHTRNQLLTEPNPLWEQLEGVMKIYSADPQRVESITNQNWLYA